MANPNDRNPTHGQQGGAGHTTGVGHSAGGSHMAGGTAGGGGGQGGKKDDQGGILSQAADVAGQVRDRVSDAASGVVNRVEDAWDATRSGVRQGASYVADKAGDAWDGFNGMVARYPLASVMVAFGLGCLVTTLLSSGSSSFGSGYDNWRRMSRSSA